MPTEQLKVVNMISTTPFLCDDMIHMKVLWGKMGVAPLTISTLFMSALPVSECTCSFTIGDYFW